MAQVCWIKMSAKRHLCRQVVNKREKKVAGFELTFKFFATCKFRQTARDNVCGSSEPIGVQMRVLRAT